MSKKATQKEIKKAFNELSKKYHPDKSKEKDATQKFQSISEAYDVLKDTKKRELYDRHGK